MSAVVNPEECERLTALLKAYRKVLKGHATIAWRCNSARLAIELEELIEQMTHLIEHPIESLV